MGDMERDAEATAPNAPASNPIAHDIANATVSLLPPELIELCDLADCDWASIPLPASVAYNATWIPLAELHIRCAGDLNALPVLTLLALADAARPFGGRLEHLWPDALATATAVVAPTLLAALARPLARALAQRAPDMQLKAANTQADTPLSALLFEPTVVIECAKHGASLTTSFDLWTPAGGYWSGSRGRVTPQYAPLISGPVRQALTALGFNARATLDSLPWRQRRTLPALRHANVLTVGELVIQTPEQILMLRNVGAGLYEDIVATLRHVLAPWLTRLPLATLFGEDAPATLHPYQGSPSLVGAADTPVHPPFTPPLADTTNAAHRNPFAALCDSDLGAALDLFGVAWRDTPLRELAPHSLWLPLHTTRADWASRFPTAPDVSLVPADADLPQRLAQLAPHLTAHPISLGIADQSLSQLLNAAEQDIAAWRRFPEHIARTLAEIASTLSLRLLKQVLRPAAFQQGYQKSLASLCEITISGLLSDLFLLPRGGKPLKPATIQLLVWRHGLEDGETRTLESMGQFVGVTRERVRQIEQRALDDLGEPSRRRFAAMLGELARLAVQDCGGVATLARASARLGSVVPFGGLDPEATLRFIARWSDHLTVTADSLLIVQPYTEDLVRRAQQALGEVAQARHAIARDELISEAIDGRAALIFAGAPFVGAVLDTMSTFTTKDGRYQPAGRGSLKSHIVLAMRSLGHPAHFTKIASEYRRLFPEDAARSANSVHAFFSRFEDTFVLVGNGAFALTEWGYDPQLKNIPTLVEHILEQSDAPLHEDDVVVRALDRYQWKAQSIRAQLVTNPRITAFGAGFFGLRDHDYGAFDSTGASGDGARPGARDRLVTGAYTNQAGHRVVRLRLTANCLSGLIPLTSRPVRELFPELGAFLTQVWIADGPDMELTLTRANHAVSGFRPLFAAVDAHAGDELFIERFGAVASGRADRAVAYQVAWATAGDAHDAMRVVGLSATGHGAEAEDMAVLHYARKPYEVARLVEHASEHPWTPMTALNTALGCLPHNPAASEYLRLGQATGMMAVRENPAQPGVILRPTALGRRWAFAPETLPALGRQLALSLPAYRAHVRGLASSQYEVGEQGETQRLGEAVIAAWDQQCSVSAGDASREALEQSAAFVATDLLTGPSLPLVLLLLLAQTQGQGLARARVDAALGGQVDAALGRLRALGLAVVVDSAWRIALAERVDVGIASPDAVERALAGVEDKTDRLPLAQAWRATMRAADSSRAPRASDLYSAVAALGPDALYDLFVAPPAQTPEAARFVDADLPYCGFPTLAADWADAEGAPTGAGDAARETIVSYACRGGRGLAPVGVALCDDLLALPWDAERRLAGNAHLLLLALIAADEGGLADGLRRADGGWRLGGVPLVSALDGVLRALGYDVWDERYRDDAARRARLAGELVAQAERFGLVVVDGGRMEAVNGLATQVYYEACDRGFVERMTAAAHAMTDLTQPASRAR